MDRYWLIFIFIACSALLMILLPLRNKKFVVAFVPLFLITSLVIYHFTGSYSLVLDKKMMDQLMDQLVILVESPDTSAEDLHSHLKKIESLVKNNTAGQVRMAELYQQGGFYEDAIAINAQLMHQFPETSEYALNWIYCHSLKDKGLLPTNVREQADNLLPTLSDKMMLLNLLAIDDYFHGRFNQAIQTWNHILNFDQSLTPERKSVLQNAIVQAKQSNPSYKTVGFNVTVKLGKAIKAPLSNEIIYIYVRRPSEKRPILVAKRNLMDLPLTIQLDETQAMLGEMLTPGMEVMVAAHISKQGLPQLQSGDIQGMIGPIQVKPGIENVTVEINEIVERG